MLRLIRGMELKFSYPALLTGLLVLLVALFLATACFQDFDYDEFEHIHTAWLISQGQIPYSDFYQNHHPLLWGLLWPLIAIVGETSSVLFPARGLMVVFSLLSAFWIGRIASDVSRSREMGLLAAVLLLSVTWFQSKSSEIRPDVPQIFFALVSVRYYLRYLTCHEIRPLIFSGIFWAISFLFLQKSVFLLAGFGLVTLWFLNTKRMPWKHAIGFGASLAIPFLIFLAVIMSLGMLKDYFWTNWIIHAIHQNRFSALITISSAPQNGLFLFLALAGSFMIIAKEKTHVELRTVVVLGLVVSGSLIILPHPYSQYFLLPVALLSVPAAYILHAVYKRLPFAALVLLMVLVLPGYFRGANLASEYSAQYRQIRMINYVIQNTNEDDYVYDGNTMFNLFRKDLHYFWYSTGKYRGLKSLQQHIKKNTWMNCLLNESRAEYDLVSLIRQKKPAIISNFQLNLDESGLLEMYVPVSSRSRWEKYKILIRRSEDGH